MLNFQYINNTRGIGRGVRSPYLLTAFLSALVALVSLAVCRVWPFGGEYLAFQDNAQQVGPDFGYVLQMLSGRSDLFWSYACGGLPRVSAHPTFIDLLSPLTWGIALLPGLGVLPKLSLLFISLAALMPLGALFYLRRTFRYLPDSVAIILSLSYGFSYFFLTKYTALNLLYPGVLFPFFVYGLDMLLKRGKWLPYTLLLTIMMMAGCYYGYMWLLFAIIYAAARAGWRARVRQHHGLLLLATLLAFAVSALFWLPSAMLTQESGRAQAQSMEELTASIINWELATRWLLPAIPAILLVVTCSSLRRLLWMNRYGVVSVLLLVALLFPPAHMVWHASVPNGFPGRFAYMLAFTLICLAAMGWRSNIRIYSRSRCLILAVAYAAWVFISGLKGNHYGACMQLVWAGACLPILLLMLHREKWAVIFTFGLMVLGTVGHVALSIRHGHDFFDSSYERIHLAEWAQAHHPQKNDNAAGRIKGIGYGVMENVALFTSYEAHSSFVASQTQENADALIRWGYFASSACQMSSDGGTIFSDTLLGTRYFVAQGDFWEGRGLPLLAKEGAYQLYENPWYFGMGMMVPDAFDVASLGERPELVQINAVNYLTGADDAAKTTSRTADSPFMPENWSYIMLPAQGLYSFKNFPYEERSLACPYICLLPHGTPISVSCRSEESPHTFQTLAISEASLYALKDYALKLPVDIEYAGSRMRISCTSTEERRMLFLPYFWREGYTAEDEAGNQLEVLNNGGFISIVFPQPGEHEVVLEWHRPCAGLGWGISGVGILVMLLMCLRGEWLPELRGWFDSLCCWGLQISAWTLMCIPVLLYAVLKAVC